VIYQMGMCGGFLSLAPLWSQNWTCFGHLHSDFFKGKTNFKA
jgi:hypothetical protein